MKMKRFLFTLIIIVFPLLAYSQMHTYRTIYHEGNKTDTVYIEAPQQDTSTYVDEFPKFNGNLAQYIASHKQYPVDAKKKHISGVVEVVFAINKKGMISDAVVSRKVYPSLDAEALKLVNAMPPWEPAKLDGKPVKRMWVVDVPFHQ